jgi:hypothetical protein
MQRRRSARAGYIGGGQRVSNCVGTGAPFLQVQPIHFAAGAAARSPAPGTAQNGCRFGRSRVRVRRSPSEKHRSQEPGERSSSRAVDLLCRRRTTNIERYTDVVYQRLLTKRLSHCQMA